MNSCASGVPKASVRTGTRPERFFGRALYAPLDAQIAHIRAEHVVEKPQTFAWGGVGGRFGREERG